MMVWIDDVNFRSETWLLHLPRMVILSRVSRGTLIEKVADIRAPPDRSPDIGSISGGG